MKNQDIDMTNHNGRLPSFDELMASIPRQEAMDSTQRDSIDMPFTFSRKTPTSPPKPIPGSDHIARPPSTPPAQHAPPRGRARTRAYTAPSLHRQTPYEMLHPHASVHIPQTSTDPRHTLGLSRRLSHEHHGDRVQEIKDGDGEIIVNDAVSPNILPYRAKPHFHGRHFSTTSLPILPPHHPIQHRDEASTISPPTALAVTPTHRAHSMGSHSPLSTCDPMTPRSIHMTFGERPGSRLDKVREEWWEYKKRERSDSGASTLSGYSTPIRVPTLPDLKS